MNINTLENKSFIRLCELSKSLGIKKVSFVSMPGFFGYVFYVLNLIKLNEENSVEENIATMCHEIGHLISRRLLVEKVLNSMGMNLLTENAANLFGGVVKTFFVRPEDLSNEAWKKYKNSLVKFNL